MRKKGHRTLNPANRFYDQFYLINYLQVTYNTFLIVPMPKARLGFLVWSICDGAY